MAGLQECNRYHLVNNFPFKNKFLFKNIAHRWRGQINQTKHHTHQGLRPAGVALTQWMMAVGFSHFLATVTKMHLLRWRGT